MADPRVEATAMDIDEPEDLETPNEWPSPADFTPEFVQRLVEMGEDPTKIHSDCRKIPWRVKREDRPEDAQGLRGDRLVKRLRYLEGHRSRFMGHWLSGSKVEVSKRTGEEYRVDEYLYTSMAGTDLPDKSVSGDRKPKSKRPDTGKADDGKPRVSRYNVSPLAACTEIEKKGKGLVARHTTFPGQLILAEEPMVIIQGNPGKKPHFGKWAMKQIKTQVEALNERQRRLWDSLLSHDAEDEDYGRAQANSIQIKTANESADARTTWGIFPNIAFVNHDCTPNACFEWGVVDLPDETAPPEAPRTVRVEVGMLRAMDLIPQKREITINYFQEELEDLRMSKERRSFINRVWNFECSCAVCIDDEHWVKVSDANRQQIKEDAQYLYALQNDKGNTGLSAEALRRATRCLKLCTDEEIRDDRRQNICLLVAELCEKEEDWVTAALYQRAAAANAQMIHGRLGNPYEAIMERYQEMERKVPREDSCADLQHLHVLLAEALFERRVRY